MPQMKQVTHSEWSMISTVLKSPFHFTFLLAPIKAAYTQ